MSNQVLSVEQMQHLKEMGLELKPTMLHYFRSVQLADAQWYLTITKGDISNNNRLYEYIPAYTLQDILNVLPKHIATTDSDYCLEINTTDDGYDCILYRDSKSSLFLNCVECVSDEDLIDAAYKLLCCAIENGCVETNKVTKI